MKSKFLAWGGMLFALCAMLAVTSCSNNDEEGDGKVNPDTPATPTAINGMMSASVMGIVSPEEYGVLRGVTVTSGDQTVETDLNGMYKFDKVNVVNGRVVLKFKKNGYMTVVRSVPFQKTLRLDVSMKGCYVESFTSSSAKTLSLSWGDVPVTVVLPADGYVKADGTAYNEDSPSRCLAT